MSTKIKPDGAAAADAIIDRAFAAAFEEVIRARAGDDVTIGVATKEFLAAWRQVADDCAARSGMGTDLAARLSALESKISDAAALARRTAAAFDASAARRAPDERPDESLNEVGRGVVRWLDSIWTEVGYIREEIGGMEAPAA